jgi:hypothetical protein
MRVDVKKLLETLGVGHVLSPYETQPWLYYDPGKGITCSAEVRMGPSNDEIEAEIQFMRDETDSTDGNAGETGGALMLGPGTEQIMRMRATPADGFWTPREVWVKGESYVNKIYNWEEKGCNFFRACIDAVQMNELPNIEELIEKELSDDDEFGGGRRGRIGRKSPKIKPAQLLGMKKGM